MACRLALGAVLLQAAGVSGWDLVIETKDQLVCTGGASYTDLGPLNTPKMPGMRSGNPGGPSECRLKLPAPVPLSSIQMTFQYVVGYTPKPGDAKKVEGPMVSIWAQDVTGAVATDTGAGAIYQSPQLPEGGDDQKYSFDHCTEKDRQLCYSPNIAVNVDCSGCTGRYIAFKFENKDRNLQIVRQPPHKHEHPHAAITRLCSCARARTALTRTDTRAFAGVRRCSRSRSTLTSWTGACR